MEVWALTCPQCEDHLRFDSLWSSTSTTIPETPDEVLAREANEKRTSREQQERNVDVMEKLGGMPEALRNIGPDLAQALMAALAPLVAKNVEPVPVAPVADDPASVAEPEPQDAAPADTPDLDALSMADLRKIAAERGVPVRRSREDMVASLQGALAS